MTLAQYLAADHPDIGQSGDSTEDKAIAVMRDMDRRLGLNTMLIAGLTEVLQLVRIYVAMQTTSKINSETAKKDLAAIDEVLERARSHE